MKHSIWVVSSRNERINLDDVEYDDSQFIFPPTIISIYVECWQLIMIGNRETVVLLLTIERHPIIVNHSKSLFLFPSLEEHQQCACIVCVQVAAVQ